LFEAIIVVQWLSKFYI